MTIKQSLDDNPLYNDHGTYNVVKDGSQVLAVIGLGEDERPSTIIGLIQEEIKSNLEILPELLRRLDGSTVEVVDQSEFHSDMQVLDAEGKVILALHFN